MSLDLFGAETSTNAANYFAAGLKGRFQESKRADDHRLHDDEVEVAGRGRRATSSGDRCRPCLRSTPPSATTYVDDCQKGVDRWNRTLADVGAELRLPHVGFHRHVGAFAGRSVTPDGRVVGAEEWDAHRSDWLPTDADREHVESLMLPVTEPGRMASWVAPPASGIHGRPVDFEYVRA